MGKMKKRPAHEVILDKLDGVVAELVLDPNNSQELVKVKILTEILQEMVIPDKHREEIMNKLHQLLSRSFVIPEIHGLLTELTYQIMSEGIILEETT